MYPSDCAFSENTRDTLGFVVAPVPGGVLVQTASVNVS